MVSSKAEDFYAGSTVDNLNRKIYTFLERCNQDDLCPSQKCKDFSILISGAAKNYFFDKIEDFNLPFDDTAARISERYEPAIRTRELKR